MITYEEKKEILSEKFGFPCRVVLYLSKGKEGFTILASNFKDKKRKLENIRFEELQAFMFGEVMTPIYIGDFSNPDDLIDAMEIEGDKWLDKATK